MSEHYAAARKAAETMEGKCVSPPNADYWCSWHDSRWSAGFAVCGAMNGFIKLAEQAIEEAEPSIRAEEREEADHRLRMRIHEINDQVKNAVAAGQDVIRDDLRARVEVLPRVTDDYYREAVLLEHVRALFPKEKP